MSTARRIRDYSGPALFSYGFRPFFLFSGLWSGLAMVIWVLMLSGAISLPTALDPISWHAHEFIFGYLGGVIAGFILTAVPNWTGRLPVLGVPLAGLVGLWVLGRVAIACSAQLDWRLVALADLSFGVVLLGFLLREVVHGRNWRNAPVLGLIGLFILGNAVFHVQAARGALAFDGAGARVGLSAVLLLVALIGGRIIPSFTRNWLAARGSAHLPVPFGRGDGAVLGLTVVGLLAFIIRPDAALTIALLVICGAAHLWRLSRWQGARTWAEPLLIILHVAYALLALGFLSEAAGEAGLIPVAAGRHVWLAGGVGLMTLAVMTRATLGHTGRSLHAGPATVAIYLAALASVVTRLCAGIWVEHQWLVHLSGALWASAFFGFALCYLPALAGPRLRMKAPNPAPQR